MLLEKFKMIDRVEALSLDSASIVVSAIVPDQSTIFEGHFPGYPIMPGVLLIEAMAQASGYLLLALNEFSRMPFLASVKEAKLRSFVVPGAELTIKARREHDGSGYAITHGSISCCDKRVCDSQLSFRTVPFPNPEVEQHVHQRALETGLLNAR